MSAGTRPYKLYRQIGTEGGRKFIASYATSTAVAKKRLELESDGYKYIITKVPPPSPIVECNLSVVHALKILDATKRKRKSTPKLRLVA